MDVGYCAKNPKSWKSDRKCLCGDIFFFQRMYSSPEA